MNYTDKQLKAALAKMLPETLVFHCGFHKNLAWKNKELRDVLDAELLHLCWLAEGTLSANETEIYEEIFQRELCLYAAIHASWQQRVEALAKVKGIEI